MPEPINFDALSHFVYVTDFDGATFPLEGAQDGDFISVTYDNDALTGQEGAQGDVQWNQRVPSLGTVVFTGQWGANSSPRLNKVFIDQSFNNKPPQKMQIKRITDTENTVVWDSDSMRIQKSADWTVGSSSSPRAWSLKVGKLKPVETESPT